MCEIKFEENKEKVISIEYFQEVLTKIKGEFEEIGYYFL